MRVTDEKDEKDERKMRVKNLRGKDLRGKGCSSSDLIFAKMRNIRER